jgi:hypothetical protein
MLSPAPGAFYDFFQFPLLLPARVVIGFISRRHEKLQTYYSCPFGWKG